ncbi:MAG: ABC transporter ATP-binding protein [Rhodocyclaceae bacterium]
MNPGHTHDSATQTAHPAALKGTPSTPGAAARQPQLRVERVSHAYALSTVLEDISLAVGAGQVVALVGPSGCGKTTLLHLCAGLTRLREGHIQNDFLRPASVFQQPRLLPWVTALANIALGLKAGGVARREREARATAIGLRMGLAREDLGKFPHQLSGGMQSRVALARALVLEPDLLLLDEPFAALDVGLKAELYALLLQHLQTRAMGVLMITHDLMEALRLSDQLLVMAPDPGRIVRRFDVTPAASARDDDFVYRSTAQLLQDPQVRASFGLPPATPGAAASPAGDAVSQLSARVAASDPPGGSAPPRRRHAC